MPRYWESVSTFSLKGKEQGETLTLQQAQMVVENLEVIDKAAFTSDEDLIKEIVQQSSPGHDAPLGVVLVSSKTHCSVCGSKLYIQEDRVSAVTLYDDKLGTMPASHFTKYCRKKGCSYAQCYGFSTQGNSSDVVHVYDKDWSAMPYFMSSRETAFSLDMLRRLDCEILHGQISYKQRAEIYNDIHCRKG